MTDRKPQDAVPAPASDAPDTEAVKPQREYESDYAKLSMQGGHKDLLAINGESNTKQDEVRKQKGCDTESLTAYTKLAREGGHKDLLKINGETDANHNEVRRQKGCDTDSEYTKLARGGGHKGLLGIEENKPQAKVEHKSNSGDWYKHDSGPGAAKSKPAVTSPRGQKPGAQSGDWYKHDGSTPTKTTPGKKAPSTMSPVVIPEQKGESTPRNKPTSPRNKSTIFGGGSDSTASNPSHGGRKTFDHQSARRDAPFATNF